ncbi:cobalamin B12-binding domain-containing protein [Streptomyces sp. J2-1]|uniref:cobalamin B12-binding domain-containing protein n=1 Tax=Streptomyces corallincola TaxID=2851888 RepID=UPI001C3926CB|nr:cobalamin B12-binding domain-containing protein [Streptomyces corallincola]MBV2354122.1 cobalamin B12-binding domain-containing protein [Streptomyces corallincola]
MTRSTTATDGRPALRRARRDLWRAVCDRDEHAARQAVFTCLDTGTGAEAVLLDVIAAVQRKVGTEWAADRFTVAQEHAATAIHDRVIAAMAHHVPPPEPRPGAGTVTVACVDGEWHALPARILNEVLRHRGYGTEFLGAQVPTPHLIAHLHQTAPDALALSSSIATRLPDAHTAITAAQAIGVPVLAGGGAFGADGRYARLLGADAWAPDARAAAAVLDARLPRPRTGAVRQTLEDLPHLADQEYTLVWRSKRQLVKNTLGGLETRLPAMRAYSEEQRERTAEDVAHIVDFLAAALYTDDAGLFTGFLTWTGDILQARGVPARVLDPGLALLGEELKDFPRAADFLARGRATLDDRSATPPSPTPSLDT